MFASSSVKATKPPTYTIKDTLGEPVQGTFYEQKLQLSAQEAQEEEKSSICQVERFSSWVPLTDLEA